MTNRALFEVRVNTPKGVLVASFDNEKAARYYRWAIESGRGEAGSYAERGVTVKSYNEFGHTLNRHEDDALETLEMFIR